MRDLRVAGWVVYLEFERWRVRCSGCGGVHVERLDWLAQNPRYTERFALHVGRLCTSMGNKAVAELERLHDSTVKDLSKLYMQEQVRRAGRLKVRRDEYRRLQGKDRSWIKGQRYTLLSAQENLTLEGRQALRKLLAANRRLNTAYLLKESFGQLWSYRTERGARAFFERWKQSLRWQRLGPYRKFADMIERHWDGIAAYCRPENKVSLRMVEGLNDKIRVIQRSAYGYRDEEYLRLKVIASFLPPLPETARLHPH